MKFEQVILENLIHSDEYFRTVIPHISEDYFDSTVEKFLVKAIKTFSEKHHKAPNQKILSLMVGEYKKFSQDEFEAAKEYVNTLTGKEENHDWLVEHTEKFCRDKAVYNGIMDSIAILDDEEGSNDSIPSILSDALNVSFDKSVGHDFFENAEERYDFYHAEEDRVPFRLDIFNKITKNGLPRKTLNCALAPTGVGKSLLLCDYAASALTLGYNVLYITLEMAEERISERIDCNILDVNINHLPRLTKSEFVSGINKIENKTKGRLIVKEFPTASAHVGHFRALIEELKLKKGFIPDVICIDYINICASEKYSSSNYSSYTAIKTIAEEMRGLMVQYNCVGFTATQTNRGGQGNSDIGIADVSESHGLSCTVDFLFAIIRTPELDENNQLMISQLKSRYNDPNYYRKFLVGVDIAKFKLFDVEDSAQNLTDMGKTTTDADFDCRNFSELNFD